jgi:hypothetical protein
VPTWNLLLLARRPAHLVPPVLHRPDRHHLPRPVRRVPGPARRAHDHRDAGRRPPGRVWHHTRAHRFFSHARQSPDALGLVLLDGIVTHPLSPQAPLALAVDDRQQLVDLAVWRCLWSAPSAPSRCRSSWPAHPAVLTATSCAGGHRPGRHPAERVERYATRSPSKTPARSPAPTRPQPHPPGRRAHRTVRPTVPEPDDLLVHAGRRRPRRRSPPPRPRPSYQTKHAPSVADMLAALRRVLIAAQYLPAHPPRPPQRKTTRSSRRGPPQGHEVRKSRVVEPGAKGSVDPR